MGSLRLCLKQVFPLFPRLQITVLPLVDVYLAFNLFYFPSSLCCICCTYLFPYLVLFLVLGLSLFVSLSYSTVLCLLIGLLYRLGPLEQYSLDSPHIHCKLSASLRRHQRRQPPSVLCCSALPLSQRIGSHPFSIGITLCPLAFRRNLPISDELHLCALGIS